MPFLPFQYIYGYKLLAIVTLGAFVFLWVSKRINWREKLIGSVAFLLAYLTLFSLLHLGHSHWLELQGKPYAFTDLWKTLLQISVTMLGWFVAALWAVRQVGIAYSKNKELQEELLKQSSKRNLAEEFLKIYLELANAINEIKSQSDLLSLNMTFAETDKMKHIKFGWYDLIDPINDVYSKLCKGFFHLDVWLRISKEHLPDSSGMSDALSEFNQAMIVGKNKSDPHPWTELQATLGTLKATKIPNREEYIKAWNRVDKVIEHLLEKMTENAASINKYLVIGD